MSVDIVGIKILVTMSLAALVAVIMQAAAAEGGRDVHMRFAGDLIRNIEQTDVDAFGQPVAKGPVALLRARAVGNLGKADLTAVAKSKPLPQPVPDERCPEGFLKVADITDNNLVLTFMNLSILFGDGDGVFCLNFANGVEFAGIDGTWLGGTGRFRGATGEFSVRLDEAFEVSSKTQVLAETGTITGTLNGDE